MFDEIQAANVFMEINRLNPRCLECLQMVSEEEWTKCSQTEDEDDEVTLKTDYVDQRLSLC